MLTLIYETRIKQAAIQLLAFDGKQRDSYISAHRLLIITHTNTHTTTALAEMAGPPVGVFKKICWEIILTDL
jgi:hypothetical protein